MGAGACLSGLRAKCGPDDICRRKGERVPIAPLGTID